MLITNKQLACLAWTNTVFNVLERHNMTQFVDDWLSQSRSLLYFLSKTNIFQLYFNTIVNMLRTENTSNIREKQSTVNSTVCLPNSNSLSEFYFKIPPECTCINKYSSCFETCTLSSFVKQHTHGTTHMMTERDTYSSK